MLLHPLAARTKVVVRPLCPPLLLPQFQSHCGERRIELPTYLRVRECASRDTLIAHTRMPLPPVSIHLSVEESGVVRYQAKPATDETKLDRTLVVGTTD